MELVDVVTRGDLLQVKELLTGLPDDFVKEDLMRVPKNANGESLLMIASIKGHTEIAELLLEKGADPKIGNSNRPGYTPLHYATAYNRMDVVELLLDPTKGNVNPLIKSSIQIMTENEYGSFLNKMTDRLRLLTFQNRPIVDPEEDHPVPPTPPGYQGFDFINNPDGTPNWFDTAIIYGITHLNDKGEVTPLHVAARHGRSEILKKLLLTGANPNIQDGNGDTPLKHALQGGHDDIFIDLLNTGADPTIKDNNGLSPFEVIEGHLQFDPLIKLRETLETYFPSFQTLTKRCIWNHRIEIDKLPKIMFA